jgi:hypothetical protein
VDVVTEEIRTANPTKRFGHPNEFGATCAFLCSAHAGLHHGPTRATVPASRPNLFCNFSPGSIFPSWALGIEKKIAGVQVCGSNVCQQQGVVAVERDQRIATLLGFGRKS